MEQEKNKLLPCPFCGKDPKKRFIGNEHTKRRSVEIYCPGCRVKRVDAALIHSHEWLDDVASKYWNTRSLESHMKWIEQTEKDFAEATTKIVSGSG